MSAHRLLCAVALVACAAPAHEVAFVASRVAVHDAGPSARSKLQLPAVGTVVAATLDDGWPVWVARHDDGGVTVISAVVERDPKQIPHKLVVGWIPGTRRFVAGGLAYDERGIALGYRDVDACLLSAGCPTIDQEPRVVRDLETFSARIDDGIIEVGALQHGASHAAARTWIAWRRDASPELRDEDARAADEVPWTPLSIDEARAGRGPRFAIVIGSLVRSTTQQPVLCTAPMVFPGCGRCTSPALPLAGIASTRAGRGNAPIVQALEGAFLTRRDGAVFSVIAIGAFRGECGGSL